jgi:hypothetical protein
MVDVQSARGSALMSVKGKERGQEALLCVSRVLYNRRDYAWG